ncbi:SGNH/GDSL hydrolase family protein [Catenuloplanes sp. NPDC051500]|uniref:SGNH/GDSL hydrolase family protein n=1 Tax=Catenuloplanes sp. NPDC051500 TaxID=3363959 RepID=UPI0037B47323
MRFLAIGDSFTEGVGDELPDGTIRGWADLVAAGLAAASGEQVEYANLAVRGRLLEPIINGQLEDALAMSPLPTLISLNGGGNDMLRRGMEVSHLMRLTEHAVARCAESGVRLLLISGPDPSQRLPFGKTIHRRGSELTVAVAELAARHGLPFANSFDDVEIRRPEYWAPDRLHLNAAGHRRVAGIVLTALGHAAGDHRLDPATASERRLLAEARYYREHVVPWLQRRVRGRSSGDGRSAKYPAWTPVPVA